MYLYRALLCRCLCQGIYSKRWWRIRSVQARISMGSVRAARASSTRQADVLVAAAGHANMITAEMVRPGAVVIDVGINELPGDGIVGDVDFASVREVAGAITPTPGGVGPLTIVVLLKQCVQAAWPLAGEEKDFKTAA